MESDLDPQEALNEVAEANRSVADRLITPVWYHPVLGLLAGGFLVAYSLGSTPVRVIVMVVYLAGTTGRVASVVGVGVVLLVATVVIGRRFDEAVRQQLRSAP